MNTSICLAILLKGMCVRWLLLWVVASSVFKSFHIPKSAQHSVHPTGGSLRVFKHFVWLGVDSGKMALSRPAHQRVTLTVGRLICLSLPSRKVVKFAK